LISLNDENAWAFFAKALINLTRWYCITLAHYLKRKFEYFLLVSNFSKLVTIRFTSEAETKNTNSCN